MQQVHILRNDINSLFQLQPCVPCIDNSLHLFHEITNGCTKQAAVSVVL